MSVALVNAEERKQLAHLAPIDAQVKLIDMWLYGKSKLTIDVYRRYITSFLAFVAKPIVAVTLEDLYDFAMHLEGLGLAPNTQTIHLSAVKSLLTFATKMGIIPFNIGAMMSLKSSRTSLNEKILSESEITRLIWSGEKKPRNRAILRLLYGAGLRVSELVALKWKDLAPRGDSGQVTVLGKGDRVRSILLPKTLWDELLQLKGDASELDPVFPSRNGQGKKHLDRKTINVIIKAAAIKAEITTKASPHFLRHSHASHSLERGANIGLVQSTLGHANVSTTSRYLHARPDDSSAMYLPL